VTFFIDQVPPIHLSCTKFCSGAARKQTIECEVRRLDEVLREIGIAQVDLIKIDCEGAEADVFSTLPDAILNHCQWIVGEFHDHTGFGVLARLAPHFHLDLKKNVSFAISFSRMQPQ
jgi:hypothetical protein